jgi:hypothetical protein
MGLIPKSAVVTNKNKLFCHTLQNNGNLWSTRQGSTRQQSCVGRESEEKVSNRLSMNPKYSIVHDGKFVVDTYLCVR